MHHRLDISAAIRAARAAGAATPVRVSLAAFLLVLAWASGLHAQQPAAWEGGLRFGTFSIAAVDRETGEVGVAVTSRVPCVGNVVPHVRVGVGAVATQALTRVEYGTELLDLLESGVEPERALAQTLARDDGRAYRQVGVIAADGDHAQHTGGSAQAWAGHRDGKNYIVQGNVLVGADVLRAVATSFERSEDTGRRLADRLIEAIEAGDLQGGDRRKGALESAAIVVADPRRGRSARPDRITVDINICEHAQPVDEMRRVYDSVAGALGFRTLQQFYGSDVIQLRFMLHALGYYRAGERELRVDASMAFYTQDVIEAVNAFRAAHRLTGPGDGTPPGLVDEETLALMWADLEKRGLADDVRRRIRDFTRI